MTTPADPMAEIRASFFVECEELLEALQDGLQLMEDGKADAETINVVFRAVHSIKGGAGAFGLDALVQFAHRFETALDAVRAGRMQMGAEALKLSYRCTDHLSDLVRASHDDSDLPLDRTQALLSAIDTLLASSSDEKEAAPEIDFQPVAFPFDLDACDLPEGDMLPEVPLGTRYHITFRPLPELFETGNEPFFLLQNLAELGRMEATCETGDLPALDKIAPEIPHLRWAITLETEVDPAEISAVFEFVEGLCALEISADDPPASQPDRHDVPPAAPETQAQAEVLPNPTSEISAPISAPSPPPAATSVVRVDLERIERLVNLVGELVINQSMLSQSLEQSGLSPHSDAMNGLEEFQRLTRNIQDSVMMIRAQPVKSLFQRMARIVREASAMSDKDVRLITDGETTEVDKTVIERLADPLTHMIRNAIDHGLESTQDREAAGKPAQGQVRLSAMHRSGRVIIEVADDGGGVDRPRVRQIAIGKGLIPADAVLSDSEIDNLLWTPGFSTASEITDLSGRGVGMDVVRTEIQSLGGRITITSQPGEGTTFTISLPLTLAVLDGMVVQAAGETLVLPLNLVIETLTLEQGQAQELHPGNRVLQVRGDFVPIIDLARELGYRAPIEDFEGSVVLLIAGEEGDRAALVIDNILDQRQVVIKGLNDSYYRAPGVAAATILGDGQIALILDPSDIIAQALRPAAPISPVVHAEGIPA